MQFLSINFKKKKNNTKNSGTIPLLSTLLAGVPPTKQAVELFVAHFLFAYRWSCKW